MARAFVPFVVIVLALSAIADSEAARQRYYAYAEIQTVDDKGRPIADRNGKQAIEGVCLVWEPGWSTSKNYMQLEVAGVFRWYTGWGYRVDPNAKTATFEHFSAPMVEDRPDGSRHRIRAGSNGSELTASLTTVRPSGCTDRWLATWEAQASSGIIVTPSRPRRSSSGPTRPYKDPRCSVPPEPPGINCW
jgi:hypothetical protein